MFKTLRVALVATGLVVIALGAGYAGSRIDSNEEGSAPEGSTGGVLQVHEVIGEDIPDDEQTADGITLKVAQARCAEGEVLTGGGFRVFGGSRAIESQVQVKEAVAGTTEGNTFGSPDAWSVWAQAPEGIGDWGLDARALCAKGNG